MPDRASVRTALSKIKRYADYEYFLDHLDNPDWVEPLAEEGFFKEPPQPVRDGDLVSFPGWAESRYLKRMAARAPDRVLPVLHGIPQTDNPRVHEDLVDAALAMPSYLAAQLVDRAEEWASAPYQVLLPEKLGQLVERFAHTGHPEQALRIARALLSVQPDSRCRKDGGDNQSMLPNPTGRFHAWEYNQILEKHMPALVEAAGEKAIGLLADLLEEAVRLSRRKSEGVADYLDFSYIWRPAIEDHEQNRDGDVRDQLVTALRNAAESLIGSDPSRVRSIVEQLERRRWKVFRRLSLHLLRVFAAHEPELVRRSLLDAELAEDVHVFHEFWLLAKDGFPLLTQEAQSAFMGQLKRKLVEKLEQPKDIEEEVQARDEAQSALASFYRRLAILRDVLPPEWREEYERLRAEMGEFPHPEFLTYMSAVWHGPTSPKNSEELRSMRVEELVDYLRSWQPSGQPMEDSREGLGRSLATAVAADPGRYASDALEFVGLDPVYVRGLISGLRDALKEKREFAWQSILTLSRWVLTQPREFEGRRSEYHDLDPGWVWTRKAIADLLSAGFDPGPSVPYALRAEAWEVLRPLTDDPDPTPEHEEKYGGSNMDPTTLSINTTRGEAMHGAVRYGLWIRRHFESTESEKPRLACGFDVMPELRQVLERHLQPDVDPSLAIRAVYGQWFAWLHLLDPKWATEHVEGIFPREPRLLPLRAAAWAAYVLFGGIYNNIFEVLRAEYSAAVERLGVDGKIHTSFGDPEARLAEHLMVFYWRKKLEIGPSHTLLAQFFIRASKKLRGHALDFVGRSLNYDDADVPAELLERLKGLWQWRFEATMRLSIDDQAEELGAFGWWFSSAKFQDDWSVRQLLRLLRRTHRIDAGHMVVKRLAEIAKSFPRESIEVLRLMIEGDHRGWGPSLWFREFEPVVNAVLASEDEKARDDAVSFIHYLGAKGNDSLEHLLHGAHRGSAG